MDSFFFNIIFLIVITVVHPITRKDVDENKHARGCRQMVHFHSCGSHVTTPPLTFAKSEKP